nr:ADP-ribosylation factor-like protein [Candidatus Sigynarchaeum springense]MDO8116321.1 ADP-ribosylation factor-like protein [Candidatus Sigynarchaeota archaeon]
MLVYFDPIFGPKIFLHSGIDVDEFKHIPPLMDLYKEGFFYHEFNKDKSANLSFQLPSSYARGNCEILMLTYLVRNGEHNPGMAKEYLTRFAEHLVQIRDAYKAFYVGSAKYPGDSKKLDELKELFDALHHSLPAEVNMFKPKERKIFVFGLTKAGKTTLLNAMQNRKAKQPHPTIFMDVSKALIPDSNVSAMIYDAPGQIKYREMWAPNITGSDGLVFVVDVADKDRFPEAKGVLHDIAKRPETRSIPLLLLLNKVDLKKPKTKELVKVLELDGLNGRPMKYFETSAVTGEGVAEAFAWLGKELSK